MKLRSTILAAVLALTWLVSSAPAFSQGCAMCYSTAAAASKEGQRAVSRGVLILLIPTVSFMTLGIALAYRYSRKRDLEQGE